MNQSTRARTPEGPQTSRTMSRRGLRSSLLGGCAVLAVLVSAACSSAPVTPARQFRDIPIPDGLELQRTPESHWFETDTYRYAVLSYEGERTAVDVENYLRDAMPDFSWRLTSESGDEITKELTFNRKPDVARCVIESVGESNSRLTITLDTVTPTESSETSR